MVLLWKEHVVNEQIRRRMKSDLIVGFGFSDTHAEIALNMYAEHKGLDINEVDALHWLEDKSPFENSVDKKLTKYMRDDMMDVFNHLNYRIGNGG